MEAIFAVIILFIIAFGILAVARSDASPSHKAMLILVVCAVGVIGGALAAALIITSPIFLVPVAVFICGAVFVALKIGLSGGSGKNTVKAGKTAETLPSASADEIIGTLSDIKVGELRKFGKYYWKVADIGKDKAMFVADNVILKTEFHKKSESITWQDCTLRKYLNGPFLKSSFGEGEKSLILTTNVDNCNMTLKGPQSLPETEDKIFVWSYDEAQKYAKEFNCSYPSDYGARKCWTRTTSGTWTYTYDCGTGTRDEFNDRSAACVDGGVRPVMWIRTK